VTRNSAPPSRKERALALLRENRLDEAKALCEDVARSENNAGAWHLLGVIEGMRGDLREAERCSREAIRLHPGYADAYCNLGAALRAQERLDEAIPALRQALKLQPNHIEAHYNLGLALAAERRFDEAIESLREVIRLKPDRAEVHLYLGTALASTGRPEEAAESFRRVLALDPEHPVAHAYLGNVHVGLGRMEEAVASYRQALRRRPHDPETLNNLGNALLELDKPHEAIDCYQRALRLQPEYFAALQNLCIAHLDAGQPEKAEACARHALQLCPDNPETLTNLGSALARQEHPEEAITHYRRALALKPDHAGAHFNLGNAFRAQGKFENAIDNYREAIAIDAGHADAHFNLSLTYLALGRFEQGWDEYPWQWRRKDAKPRLFAPSPWDGSDLGSRDVFLHAEQGLGDEIFFLRFVAGLRRRGAGRIAYLANPKIAPLLKRANVCDDVAAPEDEFSRENLAFSVGDLPRLLGMKHVDEIPPPVRLTPLPTQMAALRMRLEESGPPPYIGVTWRAGTTRKNALYKEAPLERLAGLLAPLQATVLILQRHPQAGEIERFSAALGRPVHDLSALNDDLESMLALLSLIDEYVGVSNTNMHLRAGVGKTARVLVPAPPEWRWMAEGKESPWFPGFCVYRQGYDGSWDTAFAELATDLKKSLS
jgi:tetratricopeptide (TPR) repeat protein